MSTSHQNLSLVAPDFVPFSGLPNGTGRQLPKRAQPPRKPLGQILIDLKAVTPENLATALDLRDRQDVQLGDVLLAHGFVNEHDLMAALSLQWGARTINLATAPPDPRLLDQLGPEFCLTHAILPWRISGNATVVVTARPDQFSALRSAIRDRLAQHSGPIVMALASERDIHASLIAARQTSLIRQAERRVTAAESCRDMNGRYAAPIATVTLAVLGALALLSPALAFLPLFFWATLTLLLCTGLKAAAFIAQLRAGPDEVPDQIVTRLPVVSIMVPLFQEDDIAPRLIERLGRLDYPRELLDILLVHEVEDEQTAAALARHKLPSWMRVVAVPAGPIRTKPRALNYALNFCRGSIIGVYDAEDAPEPQQIHTVVRCFLNRGPKVACLQGVLDFYNARHNWLTRCFAIEYA
ncbi:MAG: glycosyltransferase, partial [Paracoccaceae bacterium]